MSKRDDDGDCSSCHYCTFDGSVFMLCYCAFLIPGVDDFIMYRILLKQYLGTGAGLDDSLPPIPRSLMPFVQLPIRDSSCQLVMPQGHTLHAQHRSSIRPAALEAASLLCYNLKHKSIVLVRLESVLIRNARFSWLCDTSVDASTWALGPGFGCHTPRFLSCPP